MMNIRVKSKDLAAALLLSLLVLFSCELGRNLNEPISYPLLGPVNLTNGQLIGNYFTLSGTAYHNSGISGLSISLTEISNSNTLVFPVPVQTANLVTFSRMLTVSNFGAYIISCTARNSLGASIKSDDILLYYQSQSYSDETPPSLIIESPQPGQVVGSSFQLSGKIWDSQSGVSGLFWKLDDGIFLPLQINISNFDTNISLPTIGKHTNYIYARDGVGNHTTTNRIIIDYQSGTPYITINSPLDKSYTNVSQISLSGIAGVDIASLSSISIKVNNNPYRPVTAGASWSTNISLSAGTNTVIARVIADNNLTNFSQQKTVYLDAIAPTLSIIKPVNNSQITQSTLLISGTASDNLSGLKGIYLAVDDFNYSLIDNHLNWFKTVSLTEGSHILRFFTLDNAGNSSPTNARTVSYTNLNIPQTTMTIHYYNYKNWSNPKIYAWAGSWEAAGGWSGTAMSNTGFGWYAYTFNTNILLNVIFSDGGADQTGNLSHKGSGWYESGMWYDFNPDWLPQCSAVPGTGLFTNSSIQITLGYSGSNILYTKYTTDGSLPSLINGTAYNNNDTIMIGSSMSIGQTKTLIQWATNQYGQTFKTNHYTKTDQIKKTSFKWENATIYFAFIDRFFDGNTANSGSYGREWDSFHSSPGKFHGGDLAGLTQKLNEGYFTNLGINALWITCPMEQMHSWVEGGNGAFKHYGYHGYYPMDWTKMDANYGTTTDFQTFVDTAHSQGIRVLIDIIMNHTGYAPIDDLDEYSINVLNPGWEFAAPGQFHQYINYTSANWVDWWGPEWIRAGLPGYDQPVSGNNYLGSFSGLTDLKTESTTPPSSLPVFYAHKPDTLAVYHPDWTVRKYLISWICDWVRTYGIDGFRCDTAKHVEIDAWVDLKTNAVAALREWKQNNPSKKLDDLDLWMTGEHWNWGKGGISKTWEDPEWYGDYNDYITSGAFDSMINFDPQDFLDDKLDQSYNSIDGVYTTYANLINNDPDFNTLSYLSSHDTILWYEGGDNRTVNTSGSQSNPVRHNKTANYFLFFPGAIQIFYGDELGRSGMSSGWGTDKDQVTRSFMPWSLNANQTTIYNHWQKLGRFRNKHLAVGAGQHSKLKDSPYTFKRSHDRGGPDDDVVVIVMGASGSTVIDVSSAFNNGTQVRDYYTGATATVSGGKVTFSPGTDIILIEKI